ncbi:hypothetical protein [Citrobacter meridianamericanus]|uniref:hypothetical protein n=1 Tax=Citrobacter meridianamericanus TaxID=2894201 RepID=UPI00351CCCF7
MRLHKKGATGEGIIVFSRGFIIGTALKALCKMKDKHNAEYVRNTESLFYLIAENPSCRVVIDIPARNCIYLLCAIRRQYPTLPIIIMRRRHLFSDYVTASWLGNIWLQDYDTMMAGDLDVIPTEGVAGDEFVHPEEPGVCRGWCHGSPDGAQALFFLQDWLICRLRERLASRQGMKVILNWLEQGGDNRSCTVTPSTRVTPAPPGQTTATIRFNINYV